MAEDLSAGFYQELGQRLRTTRKRLGLTQRQVGIRLGLRESGCASYLARLENGRLRNVRFCTIVRYLEVCRQPVGAFLLQLGLDGLFGSAEPVPAGLTQATAPGQAAAAAGFARLSAGALRKQRQREERETVRSLKNEVLPLVLPYCKGRHEFKSGAYLQAAEAFYKAWKRARGRVGREDSDLALKVEFDRVEQIGLRDGLSQTAMRVVRETVEKTLRGRS